MKVKKVKILLEITIKEDEKLIDPSEAIRVQVSSIDNDHVKIMGFTQLDVTE